MRTHHLHIENFEICIAQPFDEGTKGYFGRIRLAVKHRFSRKYRSNGDSVDPACRSRHVTSAECTEMLDRYVEMSIAADPSLVGLSGAQAKAAREMKKAVKKAEKSYRRVLDQCETEIVRHEYDCAMGVKTPNDWEACID